MTKISINQEDCLGCNLCSNYAPEVFEVDMQNFKCKIKKDDKLVDSTLIDLSPEQVKQVEEAVRNCPVQAIKLSQ
ncbi:MAG: ferredoxin [Candidatus Zambryskibacteria bacterium]|nr:ferredoxin [Candidatus Zambryskibacteria bacterium]